MKQQQLTDMYKKLIYLAAAALLAACSGPRSPQEKLTVNDKKIDAIIPR